MTCSSTSVDERIGGVMTQEPDEKDAELQRLHSQADAREDDIRDMGAHEHRQDTLIGRLRR